MQKDMDSRMDKAIKSDAAALTQMSGEVPASLKSLIASTPAVQPVTGAVSGGVAGKSLMSKLTLWSAGGMLTLGAAYFALRGDDTPIKPTVAEPQSSPVVVTQVDTPKPAMNHPVETIQPREKALPSPKAAEPRAFTQAQIDSMLRAQEEPISRTIVSDSIRGTLRK